MKYIAIYPKQNTDVNQAIKAHENEYYRQPHGSCNGKKLDLVSNLLQRDRQGFTQADKSKTEFTMYEFYRGSQSSGLLVKNNPWMEVFIKDFMQRVGSVAEIKGGYFDEKDGYRNVVTIPAGYTAWVNKDGELIAESYIACSGNMAVIIHEEDTSVLYVNSYRHGIPGLAMAFKGMEPLEVVMYDSWRKDAQWWESGLESPEITFPPAQDEWEEIEDRLMA